MRDLQPVAPAHPAAAASQAYGEEDAAGQEAEDDGAGGAAVRVVRRFGGWVCGCVRGRRRFGGWFCGCVRGRRRFGSGGSLWEATTGGTFPGLSPGDAHAGWCWVSG